MAGCFIRLKCYRFSCPEHPKRGPLSARLQAQDEPLRSDLPRSVGLLAIDIHAEGQTMHQRVFAIVGYVQADHRRGGLERVI